ncbi:hypothetical protein EV652_120119 [Kribbella steppae]|uniref:Uncharacterized protein n=1 Tax=Kribbella steppae TaxID=2512223 RepID=A0A4R2GZA9_9ACTN|nr:hypothetical protein [Kribbella steppae]TCO16625.1 hypothetical protein EV652_120119 [Kribbella steppae]
MSVVDRAAIAPSHDEVVTAWREILDQASTLDLADRIVIAVKLRARADVLATYEGLARDAGDLARDARAFAAVVRIQNPLTALFLAGGLASGVLGFFGLWSFSALKDTLFSDAGMAQTTAALIGVLTVASAAVVVGVVRGAVVAAQTAVEAVQIFKHPSTVLLQEVRPAEERLFAIFGQRVPEPTISTSPLVVLSVAGFVAGLVVAALMGVGASG